MATVAELDDDISVLQSRISKLKDHRSNLTSILLSQPHLATRLQQSNSNKSSDATQRAIEQQNKRNLENIYRACAGVTAYKVQDPDPNANNNGSILGLSIDVAISSKFIDTYHVFLTWTERDGNRTLRIHKHTIPPCIPLQQLVYKWLPQTAKDPDANPEQDLVKFGRLLRKELVSWHMRVQAVDDLRNEAGLSLAPVQEEQNTSLAKAAKILNAFVSDDEASSDADEDDAPEGVARLLDIEADAAVREMTVTWSDQRTAVLSITKDGRIEKAICRTRDGTRDTASGRKAVGPIAGLIRRLNA